MMARGAFFDLTVTGRGSHAARSEDCIDPVLTASHLTTALQAIISFLQHQPCRHGSCECGGISLPMHQCAHSGPDIPTTFCGSMAGAFDVPGGRYTVTAAMPRASIMGTMIGAYLMIGSYAHDSHP
jgi:hypothetical protein